jgi:hypothetical protein
MFSSQSSHFEVAIDAAGCGGNDRGQRAIGASIVPLNIPEAKRKVLLYKRCLACLLTA